MSKISIKDTRIPYVAVAGNPNSGKSTVFNVLTGLRQKVANYAGVTVEKKVGILRADDRDPVYLIDLPGTYSLSPRSVDEEIAHDVLLGLLDDTPRPRVVVSVIDAATLERNLFFTSQLLSLGLPVVVALNMMDLAEAAGYEIDPEALARVLGVPVIPLIASCGYGIEKLKKAILEQLQHPTPAHEVIGLPEAVAEPTREIARFLSTHRLSPEESAQGEALRLVSSEKAHTHPRFAAQDTALRTLIDRVRDGLTRQGHTWWALEAETRYQWIESVLPLVSVRKNIPPSVSDRIDRLLTHRVGGPFFFLLVMLGVFISIFTLAQYPMDAIKHGFGWLAGTAARALPPGLLQSLVTDGIISGVGSVLVFLPQILLLFFFIAILEDSGYMARAAFIMDRVMGLVGLPGKAFIPFLSCFACAIPGVMGTRTIENARDRLVAILVAPLMCCSARWPVFFLLAAAVIPNRPVFGFIPLPALVVFMMVVLGVVAAIGMAGLFKRVLLRSPSSNLVMELPPYRVPKIKQLLHVILERGLLFVKKAGTVILAMTILLWALSNYPYRPALSPDDQIRQSVAGHIGRAIEPVIAPLGFDWRIGIAIVSSFAAREVFVSTMGTVYGVNVSDPHRTADLQYHLQQERDPVNGRPYFTPLRAVSIMVFFVLSMQCMSTIIIVRRETNSWKWALFQWAYMTGLAWIACFLLWQGGNLLGLG